MNATVHPIRPHGPATDTDEHVTLPVRTAQLIASLIDQSDIPDEPSDHAIEWLTKRGASMTRHPSMRETKT